MDVFLVARPTGKLLSLAAEVQEALNNRHRLYDLALPPLHLTVTRITPRDEHSLSQVTDSIKSVVSRTPPFSIAARDYLRFGLPHLAVGIAVERTAALVKLRADLARVLEGQIVHVQGDQWKPHITLVSAAFGSGTWGEAEWLSAYDYALSFPIEAECLIDRLELWYPEFLPKINVVDTFYLGQGQ